MDDLKLKKLILSDDVGEPAPEILEQLQYNFMLKSSRYQIRQNSFSGMLSWVLSSKQLISKLVIAACLTSFLMLGPVIKRNLQINNPIDSIKTNRIEIVDTAYINQGRIFNDSLDLSSVTIFPERHSSITDTLSSVMQKSYFISLENFFTILKTHAIKYHRDIFFS